MKKLLLILPIFTLFSSSLFAETIQLECNTTLSETDNSVKERYDVSVSISDDTAILNIDGNEFTLDIDDQTPDIKAFYRWNPWYRFAIDDPMFEYKYALGIPTDEDFARYTMCQEVQNTPVE